MDVLVIKDLKKSFGDKEVLSGVDIAIPEGSIFGFVGKNGAGKTTTMKAILGLIGCDGGEIFVLGERVLFGGVTTNKHIGYLPDVPEFYPYMTAREYLEFTGECAGMSTSYIKERCDELLSLVGLADENHRIKGFSRGMKQRLGIASALFASPKLLICDEPTSALDPIGRREILDILKKIKGETTVLFSTHILSDVESIATDIALLDDGVIKVCGTAQSIKEHQRGNRFAIELFDSSSFEVIRSKFPSVEDCDGRGLRFLIGADEIADLLSFVAESKIPFSKIERVEPTLESIFMEAVGK